MARFRIVQRPSSSDPTRPRFDIEKKIWWSWECVRWEFDLEDTEKYILNMEDISKNTVKTKIVKEYHF